MSLYTYRGVVDRVIDGDTVCMMLDLGFQISFRTTVRLLGINAPEKRGATKAEAEKAAAHLFGLTVAKNLIVKTTLDKSDKYGRVLGELFDGTLNLNQQMIEDGYAVPYHP